MPSINGRPGEHPGHRLFTSLQRCHITLLTEILTWIPSTTLQSPVQCTSLQSCIRVLCKPYDADVIKTFCLRLGSSFPASK